MVTSSHFSFVTLTLLHTDGPTASPAVIYLPASPTCEQLVYCPLVIYNLFLTVTDLYPYVYYKQEFVAPTARKYHILSPYYVLIIMVQNCLIFLCISCN